MEHKDDLLRRRKGMIEDRNRGEDEVELKTKEKAGEEEGKKEEKAKGQTGGEEETGKTGKGTEKEGATKKGPRTRQMIVKGNKDAQATTTDKN